MSSSSSKSSVRNTTTAKPTNVFYVWYAELCRRLNTSPSSLVRPPKIKSTTVLDFVGDRLRPEEWKPLLGALEKDTSLHVVSVRSRMRYQFLQEVDTQEKLLRMKRRFGSLWTSFLLTSLLKSLCNVLKNSPVLSCLELDGLPVNPQYMRPLLATLGKNSTLRVLSLQNCPIGDEGCRELCLALRLRPNVEVLNLSGCGLTSVSGEHIANIIKFQRINRYCECWHRSLRYEEPSTENIGGLKRITLNNNPGVGDDGLVSILDELDDDLFIKALDMQRCGVTEAVAKRLLELVEFSRSLEIADFRQNEGLAPSTVETILEIISKKRPPGYVSEYQWCLSTATLPCETTNSRSTFNSSGVHKSKSVPLKPVTSSKDPVSLRRTATSVNIKKPAVQSDAYSKKSIVQAKKDILALNTKLQEEIRKREEAERANDLLMKTIESQKHQPAKVQEERDILETLFYKEGAEENGNVDLKCYFEESLKSESKVAVFLDTTDKTTLDEFSLSNISLVKFIEEINGGQDDLELDGDRQKEKRKTGPSRTKARNGSWNARSTRSVIK